MKPGSCQPLAVERVRYVGEPIVAVAATSRAAAEDAARRVAVEYEPLPAVLDPGTALAPGAPLIHEALGDHLIDETRLTAGDVAGALAAAHRVYTREFTIGRHTGVPVEPRSLVADYEPSTRALTLWISSQVYDSGSYHAALETLLEAAGYDALRGEQRTARAAGRAVGIGAFVLRRADGPGRTVLWRRRRADLRPGGDDGPPRALGRRDRPHRGPGPGAGHADRARADRRRRARRPARGGRRPLGRHGRGSVRWRDLGEPRHADRRECHAPGGTGAAGPRPARRRGAARSPRGRHRAGRGSGARARQPGPHAHPGPGRENGVVSLERAPGRRAEPGGHGPLHESRRVDVHQRRPSRRRGGRSGDGPRARREVRGGGRLRHARQPGARRRPGAGRRRAGRRRRA